MKSAGLADIHLHVYSQAKNKTELIIQLMIGRLLDFPIWKTMKIEKKSLYLMLNEIVKILSNYK